MRRATFAMWVAFAARAPAMAILVVLAVAATARAADYQFGLELDNPSGDANVWPHTTAFLWVPPQAPRIRGVILAPANIIERRFCGDPAIRDEAARDWLAILFLMGGWGKQIDASPRWGNGVQGLLDHLAERSGYDELRTVPWILVGHSGNSAFVAAIDRQRPGRVLADVVIKGGQPVPGPDGPAAAGVAGLPVLFVNGEFEEVPPPGGVRNAWWGEAMKRFRAARAAQPQAPISGLEDRGVGHVSWLPDLAEYVALFLHKAVAARLGPVGDAASSGGETKLRDVSFAAGWLGDPTGQHPPAPVPAYAGDPKDAFWFFDQEQAAARQKLFFRDAGKKEQLLGFVEDGQFAPWWKGWALQGLRFQPLAGGQSFSVEAAFRDAIPPPFADAGAPLGHGDPTAITYSVAGWAGNVEQTGPRTFRVAFDREGVNGRTVHVLVAAMHPGDATYRRTVAIASLEVPYHNDAGRPQAITFPPPPDVPAGTASVPLNAAVDSGRPPRYYVSWGPAEVAGDGTSLRLTPIPARARFPIAVRVTAYEWGTAAGERYATAKPVTREFHITGPGAP